MDFLKRRSHGYFPSLRYLSHLSKAPIKITVTRDTIVNVRDFIFFSFIIHIIIFAVSPFFESIMIRICISIKDFVTLKHNRSKIDMYILSSTI